MTRRCSRAFTLIALLVVISIIAILAAIPFPVFAQARVNARMTTCLSNAKKIALASPMSQPAYDGMCTWRGPHPRHVRRRPAWPGAHARDALTPRLRTFSPRRHGDTEGNSQGWTGSTG